MQKSRRQNVPGLARNHHYVPQWVLRHWSSDRSRRLWVAKRVRGKWDIRQRSIKRSFSHDGLYDSYPPFPDSSPTDVVESRLSRIESRVAVVWRRLHRTFDRRTPLLSSDDEGLLKLYIWLQNIRTPSSFERVRADISYGQPEIDRIVARVEEAGGRVTEAERRTIEDGSMLKDSLQSALATSVVRQDVRTLSWRILMEQRRLVVGRAVNNVRFVITDHPVLRCNSMPGTDMTLANPHVQFWTPLSPKYALGLVDPCDVRPGAVISVGSDRVLEWNESLFRDSRVCAGRTPADLSFLVERGCAPGTDHC